MKETDTIMYYSVNPEAHNDYKGGALISVGSTFMQTMTIKEILKKWLNNEIGDGFRFKYKGIEFVIDGDRNQIRNVHKFQYEDLFEWIDTNNLDEEVEITNYVYKTMAFDELPMHSCALPSYLDTYNREIRCCPVCGGKGIVDNGFYNHTGNIWVTSTTAPEQCRSCNGKGYVEI